MVGGNWSWREGRRELTMVPSNEGFEVGDTGG